MNTGKRPGEISDVSDVGSRWWSISPANTEILDGISYAFCDGCVIQKSGKKKGEEARCFRNEVSAAGLLSLNSDRSKSPCSNAPKVNKMSQEQEQSKS